MQDTVVFLSTKVASTEVFVVLISLIAFDLWRRGKTREGFYLLIALVALVVSVILLKNFFAVPRSLDALVELSGYAFPSGHATGVMLLASAIWFYGIAIYHWSKRNTAVFLGLFILLIGYSRLYLGVHTIDQVIVGYLLGGIISFVFLKAIKFL